LESVDGVDVNLPRALLPELLRQLTTDVLYLRLVRGDDPDLLAARELWIILDEHGDERHRQRRLFVVRPRHTPAAVLLTGRDVDEHERSEQQVVVPRPFRLLGHSRAVLEFAGVEPGRRKLPNRGVHAVLRFEQVDRVPALLEPLEQRLVVVVLRRDTGQDGRR
jgi:hypothetical protein